MALRVSQHARDQPGDGLGDHERGHLAADEHVVADGDLAHPIALPRVLEHALVDALVAAARDHNMLLARERLRDRLRKRRAGRGGHEQQRQGAVLILRLVRAGRDSCHVVVTRLVVAVRRSRVDLEPLAPGSNGVEGGPPHLGLHHHPGPTTQRRRVDGLVPARRPIAQVVDADGEDPLLNRLAQQSVAQRLEVLGEDGDDVQAQLRHPKAPPAG